MTVTRSKRRNVPSEERERRVVPVRTGASRSGMSGKDKKDLIVIGMLCALIVLCLVMLQCSMDSDKTSASEAAVVQEQVVSVQEDITAQIDAVAATTLLPMADLSAGQTAPQIAVGSTLALGADRSCRGA